MRVIYSLLLVSLIAAACSKPDHKTAYLEVNVKKTTFKVGEPVSYDIRSSADNIVFYSGVAYGDTLNEYKFRDGREIPIEDLEMSFNSKVGVGSQTNQLRVMVSTNFSGVYSIEAVEAASWTDITPEFTFATSNTVVNSGSYKINQYTESGKPLYVCFKYVVRPRIANKNSRDWTISDFLLTNKGSLGSHTVTNFIRSGFAAENAVLKGNFTPAGGRNAFSNSYFTLRGNVESGTTEEYTETWIISKPINTDVLTMGPDKAIPLKGYKDTRIEAFNYTYHRPGQYTATFVAFNIKDGKKSTVSKQHNITIVP